MKNWVGLSVARDEMRRSVFLANSRSGSLKWTEQSYGPRGRWESEPNADQSVSVFSYGLDQSNATKLLVIISGTHGVEGPAGHHVQELFVRTSHAWLLPPNTAVALIHGLNPWGWSFERRVDNQNVDPNRGSFEEAQQTRGRYERWKHLASPETLNDDWVSGITTCLNDPDQCRELVANVICGQFHQPSGMFYGGNGLCWSARTLQQICLNEFSRFCRIGVIDVHTGIGPEGKGMIISPLLERDSPEAETVKAWHGKDVQFPNAGKSVLGYSVSGDVLSGMARWLPECEVVATALEMGTIPFAKSFPLLIAENWLFHHQCQVGERAVRSALERIGYNRDAFLQSFIPTDLRWWSTLERSFFSMVGKVLGNI